MTNGEKIRKMTDEELTDYIYSVFIAGKICGVKGIAHPAGETEIYIDWLKEEAEE